MIREKMYDMFDQRGKAIFDLTLDLVAHRSISKTQGETALAAYLYQQIKTWPYFQKHPDFIQQYPLPEDEHHRHNVLALVKGQQSVSNRTVVFLSHLDTVDIEEYGELKAHACDPYELARQLQTRNLQTDARADLESGEWLFGRGVADMKSGIAVELQLLKEFSEDPETLSGNILLLMTCDEEADSLGMLAAAEPLVHFAEQHELYLLGAINTDYVTQCYDWDDTRRYIYSGSMGKILPAVYVVGKASHIGQVFQGIDANLLLSQLTSQIDANMDLADQFETLVTNPPVSLKQSDLKSEYNGQLPSEGFAYYNFLNYTRGPKDILELFLREVKKSFATCVRRLEEQYQHYCAMLNEVYHPLELDPLVLTYQELYGRVRKKYSQEQLERLIAHVIEQTVQDKEGDLRTISLRIVKSLWEWSQLPGPAAVVFFVPPYYPPNCPESPDPKYQQVQKTLSQVIAEFQPTVPEYQLTVQPFFPYLSDASFCAYQKGEEQQQAIVCNMPCWGKGWQIDIDHVTRLNLPVLDIGVHGKGAHSYLERVHIPYTCQVLPRLIENMTRRSLEPQS